MKKRLLGKSGLELTELGFGGAAVGNLYRPTSNEMASGAIIAAWESGIRYFDTAPYYGYGLSERRIGETLRSYSRSSYVISTKVGRLLLPDASPKEQDPFPESLPFRPHYDYSYDGVMRSFEHSLQRIGTDYIDMIYIHDIGSLTHGESHAIHFKTLLEGGYRALADLRSQKVIRAIGLGVNEWEVCLEAMPHTDLDCVMLAGRYTLLEQESLHAFFPECEQRGISVIAAGPYNSGILANGQHYNYEIANSEIAERVQALQIVCGMHAVELPHAAVQFPLLHPQVVSVVAGMRSKEQSDFAAFALQKNIPSAFWQNLKEKNLLVANAPIGKECV